MHNSTHPSLSPQELIALEIHRTYFHEETERSGVDLARTVATLYPSSTAEHLQEVMLELRAKRMNG